MYDLSIIIVFGLAIYIFDVVHVIQNSYFADLFHFIDPTLIAVFTEYIAHCSTVVVILYSWGHLYEFIV